MFAAPRAPSKLETFALRLAPLFSRLAGLSLVAAIVLAAVAAPSGAAADPAATRMLFLGRQPDARAPALAEALVAFDRLPDAGGVEAALAGARLKARPVSILPDTVPEPPRSFEEFFVVLRVDLGAGGGTPTVSLGGETLSLERFGARLALTLEAFDARARRAAFVEVADPDDVFPAAMDAVRAVLDPLGFEMLVLMVEGAEPQACSPAQALPLSLASGLADRAPFGDGDGATSMAEAETYLGDALRRAAERGCGADYSLIAKAVDDPRRVIVAHPLAPLPEAEAALEREIFEALFLDGSEDADALAGYLGSCTYCPSEAALAARHASLSGRARIAALEDAMWEEIRDDTRRERLAIYVDHCQLCDHSDEALTRIERLEADAAVLRRELQAFTNARDRRDLAGLRAYLESCHACDQSEAAAALVTELESDTAYRAERAALAEAMERPDRAGLQAYLDQCAVCDGAAEVRAELDRLAAIETSRAPCLALAGLPQSGGPRKLEDIDQDEARAVCGVAAERFPDDALLRTILGRIAQAAGDLETAGAAYAAGMAAGEPAAFGLAAYAAYAPADGGPIDPREVERLALEGAATGDWLAHEVLTVLYSKDLVPGKSGADAFAAAMAVAREGDPLAQFFVGHYYLTGVGTEVSAENAAQWLQKAVDAGYVHASSFLAELHERGADGGARPDLAAELYWSALQQGDAMARQYLTTELASRSAEVVRIIQGKLREQGLYRGAVDGVPGPGTEAAIRAYSNSLTGQG